MKIEKRGSYRARNGIVFRDARRYKGSAPSELWVLTASDQVGYLFYEDGRYFNREGDEVHENDLVETLAPRVAGARGKIYLSGPMTGYPGLNYPLFMAVSAQLRAAGYTVYNPAEFNHDGPAETFPIRRAFSEYSRFICEEADAIVLLPGWETSKGAKAELALAENCKLRVVHFTDLRIDGLS